MSAEPGGYAPRIEPSPVFRNMMDVGPDTRSQIANLLAKDDRISDVYGPDAAGWFWMRAMDGRTYPLGVEREKVIDRLVWYRLGLRMMGG